jgi:hypothetical protein
LLVSSSSAPVASLPNSSPTSSSLSSSILIVLCHRNLACHHSHFLNPTAVRMISPSWWCRHSHNAHATITSPFVMSVFPSLTSHHHLPLVSPWSPSP